MISGTQWPASNGGSTHSSTNTAGTALQGRQGAEEQSAAACIFPRSRRNWFRRKVPRGATPHALATVANESASSSRLCGDTLRMCGAPGLLSAHTAFVAPGLRR